MLITITNEVLSKLPNFNIIAYTMDVEVRSSEIIEEEIKTYEKRIKEEYSLEEVLNIPLIKEARDAYKKLGKDPSRYRLAVESLYRRLVKGNSLYRINNVVDCGNILSIALFRSTAILDLEAIKGNVKIRIGREDDCYYGIGRGLLNISNIPVYVDDIGPFGSTTSDTERTMIKENSKSILVMIICFSDTYIEENKILTLELFKKYAFAKNIQEVKVLKEI